MDLFGFKILNMDVEEGQLTLDEIKDGLIPDGSDACCGTNWACNKNKSNEPDKKL